MFDDPLAYLPSLEHFGIKFGLDNIRLLVAALGHPDRTFRAFHVPGTNGKGSVTAMAEAALRTAGYRTGRYTSPHLVDIAERFAINGTAVPHGALRDTTADFKVLVERLLGNGELQAPPTFFEATTALAFELFRRAGVEIAVCEVGLGGRLDATNVLEPVATAITSIGFDHQQYLGNTLDAIAFEKAGIIKSGIPVVVGPMAAAASAAIENVARERQAPLLDAASDVQVDVLARSTNHIRLRSARHDYGEIVLALAGPHQVDNARVAVRLLESAIDRGIPLPADAIASGLRTVRWPGRLDSRRLAGGRELLLDAAHNPAGAITLAEFLRETRPGRQPIVFAAMNDKDADNMLRALAPAASVFVITRTSNRRSTEPAALAERAGVVAPDVATVVEPELAAALRTAWTHGSHIVVAGSIFLVGDVLKEIDGA